MISNRPLFFCHLPKTAGTSLRLAIEKSFEPYQILPDDHMIKRQGEQYPTYDLMALTLMRQKRGVKFFRGHYPFALRKLLDNPATIVVFRNPIKRTISNIRHVLRHGARRPEDVLADLDAGKLPVEDNLMTRYIGSEIDFSRPPATINPRDFLDRPIVDPDRLLSNATAAVPEITFLGLSESIGTLERTLRNAEFDISIGIHNTSPFGGWSPTPAQEEVIREHNALDLRLYGHACREFCLRYGEIPVLDDKAA